MNIQFIYKQVDYVILFKKETLKTTEQRIDLFNHYLDENLFTNQFLNTLYKMKNSILIHDVFLILYKQIYQYSMIDEQFIQLTSNVNSIIIPNETKIIPYSSNSSALTTDNLHQMIIIYLYFWLIILILQISSFPFKITLYSLCSYLASSC